MQLSSTLVLCSLEPPSHPGAQGQEGAGRGQDPARKGDSGLGGILNADAMDGYLDQGYMRLHALHIDPSYMRLHALPISWPGQKGPPVLPEQ